MAAQNITISATGNSTAAVINLALFKFGVGLVLNVPDGVTFGGSVQITGDKRDATGGFTHWNNLDCMTNLSANAAEGLKYPVTGVRVKCDSLSGGSVYFSVIQADS